MPLSPKFEECVSALSEVHETYDSLDAIRKLAVSVIDGLGSSIDTFHFTNISTPSVAGITMESTKPGIDGKLWPTADQIQELVVKHYKAKQTAMQSYSQLTPAEQKSIQYPPGWRK